MTLFYVFLVRSDGEVYEKVKGHFVTPIQNCMHLIDRNPGNILKNETQKIPPKIVDNVDDDKLR